MAARDCPVEEHADTKKADCVAHAASQVIRWREDEHLRIRIKYDKLLLAKGCWASISRLKAHSDWIQTSAVTAVDCVNAKIGYFLFICNVQLSIACHS